MWATVSADTVMRLPRAPVRAIRVNGGDTSTDVRPEAEGWKCCIDDLLAIRLLEADWDGQGAEAPLPDLVDSAIVLADLLRQKGVEPLSRTMQGVDGTVVMEWQWGQKATAEVEIIEPYLADVFVMVPGQPVEHWQIHGSVSA